ncbi:Uncharacterised protein [Streptococcus pneumoniae]|nr:Uncharacterised protein [Streptococcus pneumoniae]
MVCFFSFYTLRKSLQTTSALPYRRMITDFVSFILQPQNSCFEPACFLVCARFSLSTRTEKMLGVFVCVFIFI